MGESWSPDELRLTDPDAYPGAGAQGQGTAYGTWSASAQPVYPSFGTPAAPAPIPGFEPTLPTPQDLALWEQPAVTPEPYVNSAPVVTAAPARVVTNRGRMGLISLGVVTGGSLLGGFLLYQAVASVSLISRDPLGDGLLWLTGWVGMDVVITIGLILAVIALIRGARRGLAGLALAIGVFITPLVFLGAVQLGADVVQERARTQLAQAGGAAGTSLMTYADEHHVDLGPFRPILAALLDDGR